MARVTLAEIAARLGISKFAVSRALSGKSGVSEETRRQVRAVAADLGYVRAAPPSESTIGVIFHDADLINSELHYMIQNGVQAEAHRRSYHVRMVWTHVAAEIEAVVRSCEGVVMVGPHDAPSYARAYAAGKPIVRTGWVEPLEPVDHVSGSDHEAGAAVGNYLHRHGHRAVAYVHGAPRYRGRLERFLGLREAIERRPDMSLREMRFEVETSFAEQLEAVRASGYEPTAFFCAHDGLAVTVVSQLLRLGYRIPEDASVIGFGDFSAAMQISPHLTTVKTHGRELGAACVRILDDRIHGRLNPAIPLRVVVTGHIVERESAGPLVTKPAALRAGAGRRR